MLFWLIRIVKGEQPASKAQTHLAFESPLEELAKLGKAQNQSYLLAPVNNLIEFLNFNEFLITYSFT